MQNVLRPHPEPTALAPAAEATASLPETLDWLALGAGRAAYTVLVPLAWIAGGLLVAAVLARLLPWLVADERRREWQRAARLVGSLAFLVGFLGTLAGVIGAVVALDSVMDEGFGHVGNQIGFALRTTAVGLIVSATCEVGAYLATARVETEADGA